MEAIVSAAIVSGAGDIIVLVLLGLLLVRLVFKFRMPKRPCPRCGHRVQVGVLDCPYCDFDFDSIGRED